MAIELPPFSKIYKQREGVDKFFYDKLAEVVDTVNAITDGSTSKVTVSVKDDHDDGVAGAQVTLTSGNDTYTSGDTGAAGGASINDVPYGVYSVTVTVPEGYTALIGYQDVTVNSETTTVNLSVNKNAANEPDEPEEEPGE